MKCYWCGCELNWMSDFDYEDIYDSDKTGVVTKLQCLNDKCKSMVEVIKIENKKENSI